jgi:uncharacterized membrane protein
MMNTFFAKGVELAEKKFAETGDFKQAIGVLEKTCEMCKSNRPCKTCIIDNKIEEFAHPPKTRNQVATSTVTVVTKKTTTTVVEEKVITYRLGDIVIDGHVFIKYRRK